MDEQHMEPGMTSGEEQGSVTGGGPTDALDTTATGATVVDQASVVAAEPADDQGSAVALAPAVDHDSAAAAAPSQDADSAHGGAVPAEHIAEHMAEPEPAVAPPAADPVPVPTTAEAQAAAHFAENDMASLLAASDEQFRQLKYGDVVEGTIMRKDPDEILVDIGFKSEGIIPNNEFQSLTAAELARLSIGDEVLVAVLQPEDKEGHVVLSLDRARQEKSWRKLQKQYENNEVIAAEVNGYNKGGLLVNLEGVRGFVPASQVTGLSSGGNDAAKQSELSRFTGQQMPLKIIEINRNRNRLILSERQAVQEQRDARKEQLLAELTPGQIREGTVSSICDFGAFVDIGGADGLIHLSELSWSRVNHPSEVLRVGAPVRVYVMSVDERDRKIALSLKRTQPEPWSQVMDHYQLGQLVRGTITQLTDFGAFARLEDGIEGLIHVSELAEGRVTHPRNVVQEGWELTLRVIRIDPQRRRMGLSLKRAMEAQEGDTLEPQGELAVPTPRNVPEGDGAARGGRGGGRGGRGRGREDEQGGEGMTAPTVDGGEQAEAPAPTTPAPAPAPLPLPTPVAAPPAPPPPPAPRPLPPVEGDTAMAQAMAQARRNQAEDAANEAETTSAYAPDATAGDDPAPSAAATDDTVAVHATDAAADNAGHAYPTDDASSADRAHSAGATGAVGAVHTHETAGDSADHESETSSAGADVNSVATSSASYSAAMQADASPSAGDLDQPSTPAYSPEMGDGANMTPATDDGEDTGTATE